MLAVEAPKVTDWMQAWGSLAGLVMSTFAVIFTGLLFRHEIRVRREERRDNEAAQARLIVTRCVGLSYKDEDGIRFVESVHFEVLNFSGLPILYPMLFARTGGYGCRSSAYVEQVVTDRLVGEMVPKRPFPARIKGGGQLDAGYVSTEIYFTDANGLSWQRKDNADPVRITRPSETTRAMLFAPWKRPFAAVVRFCRILIFNTDKNRQQRRLDRGIPFGVIPATSRRPGWRTLSLGGGRTAYAKLHDPRPSDEAER
ncbi:hypothetical protein [Micromonospora haikouensis]|uniref:hypothetical protein n=1 Tax=Micromonospora haikouensis TaxID=686309 RepID=UPI00118749DE|nr:hypothetical protein [Micromonospora haikouensis]